MLSANKETYLRFRASELVKLRVERVALFHGRNHVSKLAENLILTHVQDEEDRLGVVVEGQGLVEPLQPKYRSVAALPAELKAKYQELTDQIVELAGQISRARTSHRKSPKLATKRKVAHLRDIAWVSLEVFETSGGHPLCSTDTPIAKLRVPKCFDIAGAFVLRVNGDSMDAVALPARLGGGSILPGDHVIMQWSEHREANPGDIVAAQILGNGSTLKRLVQRGGRQWLQPESHNDKHERIALSGDGEPLARVQAVMIGKI